MNIPLRTKTLHFNDRACISKEDKMRLSKVLNGLVRRLDTVRKIEAARQELHCKGITATQRMLADRCGVTLKTIARNISLSSQEIQDTIDSYNTEI